MNDKPNLRKYFIFFFVIFKEKIKLNVLQNIISNIFVFSDYEIGIFL